MSRYLEILKAQFSILADNPGAVAVLLGIVVPLVIGVAASTRPRRRRIASDDPAVTGANRRRNRSSSLARRANGGQAATTSTTTSIMPPPTQNLAEPKFDEYTLEQLKLYDGTTVDRPIFVSIKGTVFDVTPKRDVYGPPKGSYRIFAGKDASRALGLSSLKEEDAVPDWSTLEPKEVKVLEDWFSYFKKRYNVVGRVIDMPESVRKYVWSKADEEVRQP